ncbi:MAG: PKD domain-containing protein, partial [Proteobacteria bacterium]|nr:PKD domain-containing protein [Pseudomonadota bacterium]
ASCFAHRTKRAGHHRSSFRTLTLPVVAKVPAHAGGRQPGSGRPRWSQIASGRLVTDDVDALIMARKVFSSQVDASYLHAIRSFVAGGGGVVAEYDGAALFFDDFVPGLAIISNLEPALRLFEGTVAGGGIPLPFEDSTIHVTDATHPLMLGVPASFFDGPKLAFALTNLDSRLRPVAEFVSTDFAEEVPLGTYPAVLAGRCGSARVALYMQTQFQLTLVSPVAQTLMRNALSWVSQPPSTDTGSDPMLACSTTDNEPPVAAAGPDRTLECAGDTAVARLDGSGSYDPNGDQLVFAWTGTFPEGGGEVGGIDPTITLRSLGARDITLTVSDSSGATDVDTVRWTVLDRTAPIPTAALVPMPDQDRDGGGEEGAQQAEDEALFRVRYACLDACDPTAGVSAVTLNRIPVANGQLVALELEDEQQVELEDGRLELEAPSFELRVRCRDATGNEAEASVIAPLGGALD